MSSYESNLDIFESTLNLEETHYAQGYNEGYSHGISTGKQESIEVGLVTGFVVGEELGFYKGCIDVWSSVIQLKPTRFSAGVRKNVKEMNELIGKTYPFKEPESESDHNVVIDKLRLKFRMIRASLRLGDNKLEYDGKAYKVINVLEVALQVISIVSIRIVTATKQSVMSAAARTTIVSTAVLFFLASRYLAHFIIVAEYELMLLYVS
ncbi:hypothetical protein ACFE04_028067 [Oxalis oulophora]